MLRELDLLGINYLIIVDSPLVIYQAIFLSKKKRYSELLNCELLYTHMVIMLLISLMLISLSCV